MCTCICIASRLLTVSTRVAERRDEHEHVCAEPFTLLAVYRYFGLSKKHHSTAVDEAIYWRTALLNLKSIEWLAVVGCLAPGLAVSRVKLCGRRLECFFLIHWFCVPSHPVVVPKTRQCFFLSYYAHPSCKNPQWALRSSQKVSQRPPSMPARSQSSGRTWPLCRH